MTAAAAAPPTMAWRIREPDPGSRYASRPPMCRSGEYLAGRRAKQFRRPFALCQELARSLEVAVAEGVRARGEDEQERTGGEEPNASLRPHTRPRAPARPHARPAARLACADAA